MFHIGAGHAQERYNMLAVCLEATMYWQYLRSRCLYTVVPSTPRP